MIIHTITIDNYGDYCGKCKYRFVMNPHSKKELEYKCAIFDHTLERTLAGRRLCRCDECMELVDKEEE